VNALSTSSIEAFVTDQLLVLQRDAAQLVGLAAEGLQSMYDERSGAFCRRVTRSDQGLRRVGKSYASGLVATLGLHEVTRRGSWTPFATQSLAEEFVKGAAGVRTLGDLGLLFWMTARVAPDRLEDLFQAFDVRIAVDAYPDGRAGRTGALAWLLAGLSEVRASGAAYPPAMDDVARLVRQLLFVNYGGYGIFARARRNNGRGIFPDQAFAVYAFARYAQVYGDDGALRVAVSVADRLVEEQGLTGQWWWEYSVAGGRVTASYPVLSVHQYAIGPMALIALSRLTGVDYSDAVAASLAWVRFGNERKLDLVDAKRQVVWDGLRLSRYRACIHRWAPARIFTRLTPRADIIEECRPEHLGWLLYALGGAAAR
jgi:hypothetical protein